MIADVNADAVVLTDDEVAAVAHMAGRPWLRPLPTVDLASTEDLRRAVARGYRTLVLRGLVAESGPVDAAIGLVAALAGCQPVAVAVAVDERGAWDLKVERIEVFATADGGSLVVYTGAGVVTVSRCDAAEAAAALGGVVSDASGPPAMALLLRDASGAHQESYFREGASLQRIAPTDDGWGPRRAVLEPVDWEQAMRALMS